MPIFADIGGTYVNPLNVQLVEEADEEREAKREGLVVSKTVVKVVNLVMRDGVVKTVGAASEDPETHKKLMQAVVHELNIALNAQMNV